METNKMYDLDNPDPNDVSRSSVLPADRRLFLAGALPLPLTNIELAEAQAAKGVAINQATINGRPVSTYFAKLDKKDAPVAILIHK